MFNVKCILYLFIPDECVFFHIFYWINILLDASLLFASASDPAPDEVLEMLERSCIQPLCERPSNRACPAGQWIHLTPDNCECMIYVCLEIM